MKTFEKVIVYGVLSAAVVLALSGAVEGFSKMFHSLTLLS